jgi:hypothetical protein
MHSWSFRGNSMQDRLGRLHLALMAIRSPRLGRTIREQESGNWFCRGVACQSSIADLIASLAQRLVAGDDLGRQQRSR